MSMIKEDKQTKLMMWWHLFVFGLLEPSLFLTPLGSVFRHWNFNLDGHIEYTEVYIFGIRIVRWRL